MIKAIEVKQCPSCKVPRLFYMNEEETTATCEDCGLTHKITQEDLKHVWVVEEDQLVPLEWFEKDLERDWVKENEEGI